MFVALFNAEACSLCNEYRNKFQNAALKSSNKFTISLCVIITIAKFSHGVRVRKLEITMVYWKIFFVKNELSRERINNLGF